MLQETVYFLICEQSDNYIFVFYTNYGKSHTLLTVPVVVLLKTRGRNFSEVCLNSNCGTKSHVLNGI